MSIMRDRQIARRQESLVLEPATGQYAKTLDEISRHAHHLIEVVALEKSGLRDGDGYWSGTDVFDWCMYEMARLKERADRDRSEANPYQGEGFINLLLEGLTREQIDIAKSKARESYERKLGQDAVEDVNPF